MLERLRPAVIAALALGGALPALARDDSRSGVLSPVEEPVALERVTFDEAVKRATEHNPTVGQASQAILRSQALLDQAKSIFHPSLYGAAGTTILDAARGFDGNVTQPRTQSALAATLAYPFLAPAQWAAKNQAADQVQIARISAEETRRQVALAAAQAYLAVIAAERQREIALRNLETARVLEEYAKTRFAAGGGSRLNHVRSTQELASAQGQLQLAELLVRQAQEALGVALFSAGPVDADGDAELRPPVLPSGDTWLGQRPDVRLSSAQVLAADRVARDSWKSWLPFGTASFRPQYVTPPGLFEPANTWRVLFQLQIPIYDATLGPAKRINVADFETSRYRLDAVKVQARAELRLAQESVTRFEGLVASSRLSAESAAEALRITEIAYRAGATTNIEVVQAQQTARNSEIVLAVAEDRLRQARLDLLLALGQFPPPR